MTIFNFKIELLTISTTKIKMDSQGRSKEVRDAVSPCAIPGKAQK